jgi:hypothetical protein
MSVHDNRKRSFYKKVYGITPETKVEIINAQGGYCPLCGTAISSTTGVVDHDRPPGKENARVKGLTRGVLCVSCNVELGYYLKLKPKSAKFDSYLANPPASSLPILPYSWEEFERDVEQLLRSIRGRGYKGVLAIPRGGLPLGVRISNEMEVPLFVRGQDDIRRKRDLLVVDEIADTGTTLSRYSKRDTLTLHKHKRSRITPTFWLHEVDRWVVYPWEKQL